MGDNNAGMFCLLYRLENAVAVLIGQFQAVFAHQLADGIALMDVRLCQQFRQQAVTDLELAVGIKVHLVDGAAGGEYLNGNGSVLIGMIEASPVGLRPPALRSFPARSEIGRASCRERV